MKKLLLFVYLFTAGLSTVFADKTIYVAPAALGTKDGSSTANACVLNQIFGSLTPTVALDATGKTTVNFDASTEYTVTSSGSSAYDRACVLIPDNFSRKIIFEGNNSILKAGSTVVRMFRIGSLTNVELRNLTIKNSTHPSSPGGAIYFAGDSLKMTGCTFDNNSADNGGAIASRGKYIKISNSWFKNNFLLGSFQGGAISHTGTTTGGALIVENSTFSNNIGKAASNPAYGSAIITAFDGTTRNYLNTISISNSTFYKNKASLNNPYGYAAIQMDFLGSTAPAGVVTTATFANNTFYGNSNAAIRIWGKQQAVNLINNVIVGDSWDNVSGVSIQDHGIITEFSVAEGRPALVAKNNYIVAKYPKYSAKIDDATFATGNSDNNTLINTTSQANIDALALSATLQTANSPVPYLSITDELSPLVNSGTNTVSGITIPATDVKGVERGSTNTGSSYDIGAFEFVSTTTDMAKLNTNDFAVELKNNHISVVNNIENKLTVCIYLPNGQLVYTGSATKSLEISTNHLPKGILIMNINNGITSTTKKILL